MRSIRWVKIPLPIEYEKPCTIYCAREDHVSEDSGIYFFSRRFGEGPYMPYYVGKANNIRRRLGQYIRRGGAPESRVRSATCGNLDKRSQVRVQDGQRYFHYGIIDGVQRLDLPSECLRAERALIQYGNIVGWKLINNHHSTKRAFDMFECSHIYRNTLPRVLMAHKLHRKKDQ